MAYDATSGMWKPDPGSSTEDKVNGMLTAGNPYVEQAKSAGMDVANSRGLQNSSIAAGASQKAAYDAVTPIATADAGIAAQKDLQSTQLASSEKIATAGNASSEKIANLNATTQTAIAGLNIDASAKQQAAQIIATANIASQQAASQADIATLQSNTQKAIAALNISDSDKQQLLSLASQEHIANISQSTALQTADMNVASNKQDKASTAAQNYANIYATQVNTINNNKDIPAAARDQYLADAKTAYDNNLNLVQQVYSVQLDWGQNAAPTAAATPAASEPVATPSQNPGYGYDPNNPQNTN